MFFLSGTKKEKAHNFLVCCIESGAVHALLGTVYPHNKPFIAYSVSKTIPSQDAPDHTRLTATTLQTIVDVCQDVIKEGVPHISSRKMKRPHIDHTYCVYGSPWYVSQTQTVTVEKEAPLVITQKIVSDMIKHYVSVDALHAVLSDATDTAYITEQTVVGMRLNGYDVTTALGKEAQHIAFSVSSGAISNQFRMYVEESLSRFFPGVPCTHQCAPTLEFFGIRDMLATDPTFLIIDISAEITDVSVVRNGVLKETASFPFGTHSALRSFAQSTGVLPSEILGIVGALGTNTLDAKTAQRYTKAVHVVQEQWKALFEKTLFDIGQDSAAPTHAFILGESSEFASLQKLFMPGEEMGNPHTHTMLSTTTITGDTLKSFCTVREGVEISHSLLVFSSLYVHKTLAMTDGGKGVQ